MNDARTRADGLKRLVSAVLLLLMAVTWPLWWNDLSAGPRIPWLQCLLPVPILVDRALTLLLVLGSLGRIVLRSRLGSPFVKWSRPEARFVIFGAMVGLVLLDQHRLQPWICEFLVLELLFLVSQGADLLRYCRWFVCSVYVWSAISKLDVAFFNGLGQVLLQGVVSPLGLDQSFWTGRFRAGLAALFPLGELLVGLLLWFPRTRRIGLPVSWGMHLVLIWILGLGLQHEWGVLIWNAFFLGQNLLLFWPQAPPREQSQKMNLPLAEGPRSSGRIVPGLVACLLIYPLLEWWGYCDHWPAWSVYSARPDQVRIFIADSAVAGLPAELQEFVGPAALFEERRPFSLDAWSYSRRNCPIYPQLRYRLALALALPGAHVPPDALSIEISGPPDRWAGQRKKRSLQGISELQSACRTFSWNTQAR